MASSIPHTLAGFRQLRALRVGALSLLASVGAFSEGVRYLPNDPVGRGVVVVAHQDDWQLFMGDVVTGQIRAGDSITFIYLTAGDDGRDSVYWRTRERASLQSTRLATGVGAADSGDVGCSEVRVNERAIRKCVVANTTSYFLRLPDGKRNGAGFALHDYQSLRKLRGMKIGAITAVDGSATYVGWADLMGTVSKVIGADSAESDLMVHTSDPSVRINPHDHFDHRMAGLLVNDLRKTHNWDARYYVGYAVATRAANRSRDAAREKTAIFLAYNKEMMRVNRTWSAYEEHPAFYSQCMVRTYARRAPTLRAR